MSNINGEETAVKSTDEKPVIQQRYQVNCNEICNVVNPGNCSLLCKRH